MSNKKVKLIAVTAGVFWGLILFVLTLLSYNTGYGIYFLTIVQSLYIGYDISLWGSFVGFVYGFLGGFIGVYLFHILYKRLEGVVK